MPFMFQTPSDKQAEIGIVPVAIQGETQSL